MLDERHDSALVLEYLLFDRFFPFILERDLESLVQKGELPKPLRQHVEAEVECLEDLPVGLERDFCATAFGFPSHFERGSRLAAFVALLEHLAILPYLQLEPFGEGVDHRNPNAVKPAGHRIGALLELA